MTPKCGFRLANSLACSVEHGDMRIVANSRLIRVSCSSFVSLAALDSKEMAQIAAELSPLLPHARSYWDLMSGETRGQSWGDDSETGNLPPMGSGCGRSLGR
ncbi:hypothetical protein BLAT2472_60059 [Burkholderia latens]